MKAGRRPSSGLTEREQEIMSILWAHGPIFVREMLEYFPEPRPHVNTVSTIVRILEEKGHVSHETIAGSHQYYALTPQTEYRKKSMGRLVRDFFNNSYKMAVSALVEEEKVSVDELREIIDMIEQRDKHGEE
jgi:BlaI family penicillinase repressor